MADYRINHNELFLNSSLFNNNDDRVFKIYSIDQFSKRSSPAIKTMQNLPDSPKNLIITKVIAVTDKARGLLVMLNSYS